MRELKTQYRDISAMAPISVCRGITPLCTPAPLKEAFASEVGGRYSERVYSLWQRLNLFFLEETAEPAVPEKKVTLVNQFTQQIFLQLLSNKQTNRLIRNDRTYFAVSQAAQKGRQSAVASKRLTETAVKEMLTAFHEKHILTGDLCGLTSVLAGEAGRDGNTMPSIQTLALTVSHLAKTIDREKQISAQNRVLLERVHAAVAAGGLAVGGRAEEQTYAHELTTVIRGLLQATPEHIGKTSSSDDRYSEPGDRRRPSDGVADGLSYGWPHGLSDEAALSTFSRAREQYATAVEQVLRMIRERKAISEIREAVRTATNRIYDSRIKHLGYGTDYEDSAKRVRALLETVVLSDTERRTVVNTGGSAGGSADGSADGNVGHYTDNYTPIPASGSRAEIIQQLSIRLQALGSEEIQKIFMQANEPSWTGGQGTGGAASTSVVTSESLKQARAVKTAEAVIAYILQAAREAPEARSAVLPTLAEGWRGDTPATPLRPIAEGETSVLTGDVTVSRALGYDVGRAPMELTYGGEASSSEAAVGSIRPEIAGRADRAAGIPGTALVRPFDTTPLYLQRTENVFYAQQIVGQFAGQIGGRASDMTGDRAQDERRALAERRDAERLAERVADTVTNRMVALSGGLSDERTAERSVERTVESSIEHTVERVLERVPDRIFSREAESETAAALRPRSMLAQRADMVQGLHRRARRYLSDSLTFENGHGIGYLRSDGAPAAEFLPLLHTEAMGGHWQAFGALQMLYGDAPTGELRGISASGGQNVVVRPLTRASMYVQNTNHFYTYADRSEAAGHPQDSSLRENSTAPGYEREADMLANGQAAPLPRGRVRTAEGGYGYPMRLVMPEIRTEPSAEATGTRQGGTAADVRFGSPSVGQPRNSYRRDLDEKTLQALDGLIAQATRSAQAGGTDSSRPARDGDAAERRGVVRAEPAVLYPEASLYYGEAGVDADEGAAQGGMSVLRPRRSAVLSDVSEMRVMLRHLNSTARIRRYSMRPATERTHIAKLIHRLESEEAVTVKQSGEQTTILGGGFTFRTVDDGENMVMLVPPVTADSFQAESGRLRELPPITHKEPPKAETPPPAATAEKVTLNQKMESSRTVKAQVNKGFEDMSREDIAKLADKVYAQIESRLMRERRRSGF